MYKVKSRISHEISRLNDDARYNQAARVGSGRVLQNGHRIHVLLRSRCKNCSFQIRVRYDRPRNRSLRLHPRARCALDKESGAVPGRRQACSLPQAEGRGSAAALALPSEPPLVPAAGFRSGTASTPRSAPFPGLSLPLCMESRSDGSLAPGRVCDAAPGEVKGF